MTACKPFDLDDHSENYGGCEESIARSSEVIYDKKKKLPKKHYLSQLETIEIVLSYTIQQNVCNLYRAIVNRGNGYETRQSSLLYVFVLFFGLDPAQNTIVVYSVLRN